MTYSHDNKIPSAYEYFLFVFKKCMNEEDNITISNLFNHKLTISN